MDVWTWAARLFKSRSIASSACKKSQVMVNDQRCKPSRQVRVGDRIEVTKGVLVLTVEVKAILHKRVGAKLVGEYLIDHTPLSTYQKAGEISRRKRLSGPKREAGSGRPTKRERRELDQLEAEATDDLESFEKFARAIEKNI